MNFSNLVLYSSLMVAATVSADCNLEMADLNFPVYANAGSRNCQKREVVNHVRVVLETKNCPSGRRHQKKAVNELTGEADFQVAKTKLMRICETYIGVSESESESESSSDSDDGDSDEDCNTGTACTSIEALDFRTIGKCDNGNIESRVREKLGDSCENSVSLEMQLLTSECDTDDAQQKLQQKCYETFGCTTDFEVNGCDYRSIKRQLDNFLQVIGNCPHDAEKELQIITGSNTLDAAIEYISELCEYAYDDVDTTSYTDIDSRFDDSFMTEYIAGDGFLNTETGNFQGQDQRKYPVSEQSKSAGQSIKQYYKNDGGRNSILSNDGDFGNFEQCEFNSFMCCFGRDRQSKDGNGNCKGRDCDDADPGDNTNVCYTEPSGTPFPNESEDDVHCHGLAWADDSNDFTSIFKLNNFFYVSMYDHMYQRGYVQAAVAGPDDIPMCACIEDMPKVTRSDCTQVDVLLPFNFGRNAAGYLEGNTDEDQPIIEFNACKGTKYNSNKGEDNDLASYAVKLHEQGRMSLADRDGIFKTLLGYARPNDNENESVCQDALNAED